MLNRFISVDAGGAVCAMPDLHHLFCHESNAVKTTTIINYVQFMSYFIHVGDNFLKGGPGNKSGNILSSLKNSFHRTTLQFSLDVIKESKRCQLQINLTFSFYSLAL